MIKLYHGSNVKIDVPDLAHSKLCNNCRNYDEETDIKTDTAFEG